MKTTVKIISNFLNRLLCISLVWVLLPFGEVGRGFAQSNQPGAGNALIFNGVNNYVNIPDANNLSFTNSLSIEAWFSTNQNGIAHRIVGKEQVGSIWPEYFILMNSDGTVQFGVNSGNFDNVKRTTTTSSYNDGKWHHVVGTYNGNSLNIYVDGILEGLLTTNINLWNSSTPLLIGSAWGAINTTYTWQGQLDEVRIWNKALTQIEIRDNMCTKLIGNEAGLVGYWRFDETTGNTAFDSSPNGNDGTLQ